MAGISIKQAIKETLTRDFGDNRIIVWYDENGTLKPVIAKSVPEGVDLIKYSGSYLAIRAEIEKTGDLKKKRLIYIPRKPLEQSWLRDYELFGKRIEAGLTRILSDFFKLRTTQELLSILTPSNCRLLAAKWDEVLGRVEPPLKEEDAEEALLAAILGQLSKFDPQDAALTLLGRSEEIGGKLRKAGLENLFLGVLQRYGLPKMYSLDVKLIAASILLSELVTNSSVGEEGLEDVLPAPHTRGFWAEAANRWAANTNLVDSFTQLSSTMEREYDIREKVRGRSGIEKSESFKAIDEALLEEVKTRVGDKGVTGILENTRYIKGIAQARQRKVWFREGETEEWKLLEIAVDLCEKLHASIEEIRNQTEMPLLETYFKDWWRIDQLIREMESVGRGMDYSIRAAFITPISKIYQKWLRRANRLFSHQVTKLGRWPPPGFLSQNLFWERFVKPIRGKVCIFFLDALRFELQKRLAENLADRGHKVEAHVMVSLLPSITKVGMASLLPNKGKMQLKLVDGNLFPFLDGEKIATKDDRKAWLRRIYSDKICFLELDELRQDPEKLSQKVREANILVVMDREIDRAGAFMTEDLLDYFDALLGKVVRAIESTASIGFPKTIVTTDHGFLIIPEPINVETVSGFKPGEGLDVSRRYAVGKPPEVKGGLNLPLRQTGIDAEGEMLLPVGISYLPRKGGKEMYIHGGLSLQECCVGVLKVETKGLGKPIDVRIKVSEPITSQIFRLKVIPLSETLVPIPRKVKIELWSKGELLGEQKPIMLSDESIELLMKLRKTPENIEIRARDADTREVLKTEKVEVSLEGYDELL